MFLKPFTTVVRISVLFLVLLSSPFSYGSCPRTCSCFNVAALFSLYTCVLFTAQFFTGLLNVELAAKEIKGENQLLDLMQKDMNRLKTRDRSMYELHNFYDLNVKVNFSMTIIEELKRYYKDRGFNKKAGLVDSVIRYYAVSPSYFAFTYNHSPFEYEHCLKRPAKDEVCQMAPQEAKPLYLRKVERLVIFFDTLLELYESHKDMMQNLKMELSLLFQVGLSYCGHQLEVDAISSSHPCMQLTFFHLQYYYTINEDWFMVVKTMHHSNETWSLRLITLSDDQTSMIKPFQFIDGYIHP